jgi:uncharacterized membrane protein
MAKIEVSTVIHRPVEEVFAVFSNEENRSKWSSTTLEVKKTSQGPIGVGTTWRGVDRIFGRRIERESVYTEYELNRKITQKSTSGPVPFEVQFIYEPTVGGTPVVVIAEAQPSGLFKLSGPLLMQLRKRQFARDLANLKAMIEAHAVWVQPAAQHSVQRAVGRPSATNLCFDQHPKIKLENGRVVICNLQYPSSCLYKQ